MAVKLLANIKRFVGDTADAKPTGTDVPVGSTYLDRQTGALYVTYDGTNWAQWDRLIKLVAGTALVGKVGIDQTTPGTTNAVDAKTIAGQTPTLDNTTILAVSLRAKTTTAGDSPLVTNGLGTDLSTDALKVVPSGRNGQRYSTVAALGDADAGTYAYPMGVYTFNGTNWDRQRNTHSITLLASAARTAETASADQTIYNARALLLFVSVSAITNTPILTPTLQYKDSISANYKTIWTAATAISATGQYVYMFALGGSGSAGSWTEAVNLALPRTWRLNVTVADADSATYSVSATKVV